VRVVLRAIVLRQLADGVMASHVAQTVPLTPKAIRQIAHRYNSSGLNAAHDKATARCPRGSRGFPKTTQHCHGLQSSAGGRARWTVRLIVEEAVKRKLVPKVGRETIRVLLQNHELKPWREKMWWCAGINRHGVEDERALRERSSDPLGPEFCAGCCEVSSEA